MFSIFTGSEELVYYLDLHCRLRAFSFGSEAVRLSEYINNIKGVKNFTLVAGFNISVIEVIPASPPHM